MARTPRPLTIATREATKELIAAHRDEFDQMVTARMFNLGYISSNVQKWEKSQ